MPTYEYECQACGHTFEKFQSIAANPTRRCPECKKYRVQRLIGCGAALIFKGSGFYETDYRSEDYKSKAKADKDPASGASSKADSSEKGSSSKGSTDKDANKASA